MENKRRRFRWFVLFVLLSSLFAWFFVINQAFALRAKPECKKLAGVWCLNPPVMFAPTPLPPPSPTPLSGIWGDASDAPDGRVVSMTAYATPMVTAGFPTIYVPGTRSGPYHYNPETGAYLGQAVSQEANAHEFVDHDLQTNISPTIDLADRDGEDDGLGWLYWLHIPCYQASLTYTATVVMPNTPFYLNVWIDFDRDGDWDDVTLCGPGGNVSEWVIQDYVVNAPTAGPITDLISFTTTSFSSNMFSPLWARVMLSEQPAPAPFDGSGPPTGFLYGETEDYLLRYIKVPKDPAAGWLGREESTPSPTPSG